MEINYKAIGSRIKAERKKQGISQEKLSQKADLTTSHISHIETANTKLSLPALLKIANALHVTADQLLYDNISASIDLYDKEFKDLLDDCTVQEKKILLESVSQMKAVLKGKRSQ